ncbi:hypothetical protein B0H14DRAFT_3893708 [Mycena olivaceomarginata]|nr:hypothetical protein B0H14DRAFT_3893708 [Mycena olivaceomarginata]
MHPLSGRVPGSWGGLRGLYAVTIHKLFMSVAYPIHLFTSVHPPPRFRTLLACDMSAASSYTQNHRCRIPRRTRRTSPTHTHHVRAQFRFTSADPFHLSSPSLSGHAVRAAALSLNRAPCFPPVMISSGAFRLVALRLAAPISSLPNTIPLLSKPELCSAARHTDSARTIHSDSQLRRTHDSPPLWALRYLSDHTGFAHRRIPTFFNPTGHCKGYAALLDAPRGDLRLPFCCLYGQATTWMQSPSNNLAWARGVAPIPSRPCLHYVFAAIHAPGCPSSTRASSHVIHSAPPLPQARVQALRPPPTSADLRRLTTPGHGRLKTQPQLYDRARHATTPHSIQTPFARTTFPQSTRPAQVDSSTHIPQDLYAWNPPAPRAQYGPHICT